MARQVRKRGGLVRERGVGALLASAIVALCGCESGLGTCDMAAATVVVYRGGIPHYEGQALVESRCAGGFCHSANATGASRFGAPAELNFDVTVVTPAQSFADVQHHREGMESIAEWDEDISELVADGAMPPGKAGERDPGVWVHATADGGLPPGGANELFDIGTERGHEILRNWLACGHPTVTGTDDLDASLAAAVASLGGTVLPSKASATCTLTAVGALGPVIEVGTCTNCHAKGPLLMDHMLDLSRDADGTSLTQAHAALSNQAPRGTECGSLATMGVKLIVPGDCQNSLLYQKLTVMPPPPPGPINDPLAPPPVDTLCGDLMPPGRGALPQAPLDCLCQWIDAGAPL